MNRSTPTPWTARMRSSAASKRPSSIMSAASPPASPCTAAAACAASAPSPSSSGSRSRSMSAVSARTLPPLG
eukprot:4904125-Prymnesium_polylepis.1